MQLEKLQQKGLIIEYKHLKSNCKLINEDFIDVK